MKVLVTGGAGFIGANLCSRLESSGDHDIVVLDDLSTGNADNLDGLDVTFMHGSFLDAATLDDAVRGVQAVVHLGAIPSVPRSIADPVASHLANATGTVNVLEAARAEGDTHVIVASSSSVYGSNPTLPKREDLATFPLSPYAASKLATESYALSYQHSFGLPVLAFRFFNVFGPLQGAGHAYAAVVPQFVSAAMDGRAVTVHGDGEQSRDFTYVGTVCDVITDASARRVTHPEPVNLAFGTRTRCSSCWNGWKRSWARRSPARTWTRAPATCGTHRRTPVGCTSSSPTSRPSSSTTRCAHGGVVPTPVRRRRRGRASPPTTPRLGVERCATS